MSPDIYAWAPMKGVHTDDAFEHVIKSLEDFLSTKRTNQQVLDELRRLGSEAQRGFPGL